ncbi:hypothetical protein [Nocardioides speluncae]|uniref:hypothetical protein n=1 Tax=Nocardioides speluncae TaxID=2670337 RepID=UPI000D694EBA|nr:hypothetical protein [Nocardioides speluncae]
MVKKTLLTIVIALGLLLAPGSLAVAQPSADTQDQTAAASTSIRGKWRGQLRSPDFPTEGLKATVVIRRQDDGRLVGRGWRSDGDCAVTLTNARRRSGWTYFRQTVTSGSCTPRVSTVRMQRRGERLLVRWVDTVHDTSAYMYARRVS